MLAVLAAMGCDGGISEDLRDPVEVYLDDRDGDGWDETEDCNDLDAATSPSAAETCDGRDQDCDGEIDDDPADGTRWYEDDDRDGWGAGAGERHCDGPPGAGWVERDGDCDDEDRKVNPGAVERCNDVDDDCDGLVDGADDDAVIPEWAPDADADGYGDADSVVEACVPPSGYVAGGGDCDDTDPDVNPGEEEVCDGVDRDCDGSPACVAGDLVRLDGAAASTSLGVSLVSADLDADGAADLLAGGAGAAWMVPGPMEAGATVDAVGVALHVAGPHATVAAGDLTGDGRVDAIVGDYGQGTVHLLPGPLLAAVEAIDFEGPAGGASDRFGWASVVRDLDGDGAPDLAVAAPYARSGAGEVRVWAGPTAAWGDADAVLQGASAAGAGWTLAPAGDTDGDGLEELLVGGHASIGHAWLVPGGTTGTVTAASAGVLLGTDQAVYMGICVASAGDGDRDGYADVLVGASLYDGAGAVFVFRGPLTEDRGASTADATVVGEAASSFGRWCGPPAGDVDGDGVADPVVGEAADGEVVVIDGSVAGTVGVADAAVARMTGLREDPEAFAVGDLDGDARSDLLVGVPDADEAARNAGAVYLLQLFR